MPSKVLVRYVSLSRGVFYEKEIHVNQVLFIEENPRLQLLSVHELKKEESK